VIDQTVEDALTDWRDAERRLAELSPAIQIGLASEVERFRREHQRLFDAAVKAARRSSTTSKLPSCIG
jgi:hypothetical protein